MSKEWYYISEEELTTPKSSMETIVDSYWYRNEKGILSYKIGNNVSYQTNSNRAVLEKMLEYDNMPYKDHHIIHIPVAFIPLREY